MNKLQYAEISYHGECKTWKSKCLNLLFAIVTKHWPQAPWRGKAFSVIVISLNCGVGHRLKAESILRDKESVVQFRGSQSASRQIPSEGRGPAVGSLTNGLWVGSFLRPLRSPISPVQPTQGSNLGQAFLFHCFSATAFPGTRSSHLEKSAPARYGTHLQS